MKLLELLLTTDEFVHFLTEMGTIESVRINK